MRLNRLCITFLSCVTAVASASEPNDVPEWRIDWQCLLSPDAQYLAFRVGVLPSGRTLLQDMQPVIVRLHDRQTTVLPLKISPLVLHWYPDRDESCLCMLQEIPPADMQNYPSNILQVYSPDQNRWLAQYTTRFPPEWMTIQSAWNANGRVLACAASILSPFADVLAGKTSDSEERLIFFFAPEMQPVVTYQQARRVFWTDSTRLFFQSKNQIGVAELRPGRRFNFTEYPIAHPDQPGDVHSDPELRLRGALGGKPFYSVDDKVYYGQAEFTTLSEQTRLFTDGGDCAAIDDGTRLTIYNDRMDLVHQLKSTQADGLKLVAVSLEQKTCFFQDRDRRILYRQNFNDPRPEKWIEIGDIIGGK